MPRLRRRRPVLPGAETIKEDGHKDSRYQRIQVGHLGLLSLVEHDQHRTSSLRTRRANGR